MGICTILTIILAVLKLIGLIACAWWIVFLPMMVAAALWLTYLILWFIVVIVIGETPKHTIHYGRKHK